MLADQPGHCSATTIPAKGETRHQGEAAEKRCPSEGRASSNLLHRTVPVCPLEVLVPGGRWCLGVFVVKCLGSVVEPDGDEGAFPRQLAGDPGAALGDRFLDRGTDGVQEAVGMVRIMMEQDE